MKKLILLAAVFVSMNVFASETNPQVNEKVLNAFHQLYKDASNVSWHTSASYNEASFEAGDVRTKAVFDDDGKLLKIFRYYKEDKLPANILYAVQKKYCHSIWGVTEEWSNNDGTTYTLVLQCNKYWYHVKSDAGGRLGLVKKYKRAEIN